MTAAWSGQAVLVNEYMRPTAPAVEFDTPDPANQSHLTDLAAELARRFPPN
jgi:hypothetical protein